MGRPHNGESKRPTKEQLLYLIGQGEPNYDIAARYDVYYTTVYKWKRHYGLPMEPRGIPLPYFQLSPEEFQLLVGGVLGDGNLELQRTSRNPTFRETKKLLHRPYLEWESYELQRLLPSVKNETRNDGGEVANLETRACSNLLPLRRAFYPEGKKVIPKTLMWELLPLGLAVWYMGDGSFHQQRKWAGLATNSFTKEENEWLADDYFPRAWGVYPKLKRCMGSYERSRESWSIRFSVADTRRVVEAMAPYIVPIMSYKIGRVQT